jgi:uncharacterized damage-inducible protein DinB
MELPRMKSRACLALAEETETERQKLYGLLSRFPDDVFRTGDVKTEDNVRGISCHMTFAIMSYACWLQRVLGRLDLAVEKDQKTAFLARVESLTSADEFEEASRWASEHYYTALSEITDPDHNLEFKANWGSTMAIESMLEHALVHLMRHRRQLEIHLGLRPRGEIQES